MRLPFDGPPWEYQAEPATSLGRSAMTLAEVLRTKGSAVETVAADAAISQVVATLGAKRIGALPVMSGERIAGIISERDVIYSLRDHGASMLDWPVERLMTSPAITAGGDTSVLAALA